MTTSRHVDHRLMRSRGIVALIAAIALAFTGISMSQAHAAESPPAGTYTGESSAYTDATVSFEVSESGQISGFETTSYCFDGLFNQNVTWAGMPATPLNADGSFDTTWELTDGSGFGTYYELSGTINADGTASGAGRAGFLPYGTCGGSEFTWTAATDVTDPEPVYDPEVTVTPKTMTQSEADENGIAIEITGFPANVEVSIGVVDAQFGQVSVTDADGNIYLDQFFLGSLGAGEHTLSVTYGDLRATDTFTITEDEDPEPVYDPQVTVSPKTLTLSQAQDTGVDVTVTGFPAETEISVGIVETQSGQVLVTDADGNATLESYLLGGLGAQDYTFIASFEDHQATAVVTVTEDEDPAPGYDPQVTIDPETITESDLASTGITVTGEGFPVNEDVELNVNDVSAGVQTADADGTVVFNYVNDTLSPGTYTARLANGSVWASATFTVEADPAPVYDPAVTVTPSTMTQSEASENGIAIEITGFPANVEVSIGVVDANFGEVRETDADGNLSIDGFLLGALGVGEHTLSVSHEDLQPTATFTITEDDDPAPGYDPEVTITPQIITESDLATTGITVTGEGFPASEPVELTVNDVTAGMQTADADGTVVITYVNDTLAPGTYTAQLANGSVWANATFTVEADPEPVYDPTISLSATEVTESEFAEQGVEVIGSGFPANTVVTLFAAGSEVTSGDSDADGNVAFTLWGENLGTGEFTVRLEADAEGAQVETTLTVIADEVTDPVTIPATQPNPEDLDPALEGEVQVPSEAAAGQTIVLTLEGVEPGTDVGVWIFSDPAYLGTHTVDANGQVAVTIPEALAPGTHTISVWTEEGLVGWDTIVITAAADEAADPGDSTGGTDGATGTGEDQLPVTGGTLEMGVLAGALSLLLTGVGLVLLARSRRTVTA